MQVSLPDPSPTERVALTCNAWNSTATELYVSVTAHHVDEYWNLKSHVLQTNVNIVLSFEKNRNKLQNIVSLALYRDVSPITKLLTIHTPTR